MSFLWSFGPKAPANPIADLVQSVGGDGNAGYYRDVPDDEDGEACESKTSARKKQPEPPTDADAFHSFVHKPEKTPSKALKTLSLAAEVKAWKEVAERLREKVESMDRKMDEEKQWRLKYLEAERMLKEERKRRQEMEEGILSMMDATTDRQSHMSNLSRILDDPRAPDETAEGPKIGESDGKAPEKEKPTPYSSLTANQIRRYSRQLLMRDGFGVSGQRKLLSSSVLVVGAGGIGSTALLYLAAAGIGKITVVDHDTVDASNLHRQIIHKESSQGTSKALSAAESLRALNSSVRVVPLDLRLTVDNALELCRTHDVVVDATDNPRTRYVVNDACALASVPLVSGSAMGSEGQLTVYGHGDGGCYRCLYPRSDPREGRKSCADDGVLGTVPGVVGAMQAAEAIKILAGVGRVLSDRLLTYDAWDGAFLSVKKPKPREGCRVSGKDPDILSMEDCGRDLEEQFPSASSLDSLPLPSELCISCREFDVDVRRKNASHVLLDVRVERQFQICSFPTEEDSAETVLNIPLEELTDRFHELEASSGGTRPVYCLCRRGVASEEATRIISSMIKSGVSKIPKVQNIQGGLNSWVETVDPHFPMY